MLRKLKLQTRILVSVSLVTILMMGAVVWFDSYSLQKSVEETYMSQLDGMTTAINGRYEESHNPKDVQQIFDYIQYKNPKVLQLTLYGKEKITASTDRTKIEQPTPMQIQSTLASLKKTRLMHLPADSDGLTKDLLMSPLKEDGMTMGAIELVLDTSENAALVQNRIRIIILMSSSITILLLVVLYFIIRRRLIRPLMKLRNAALSVKQGAAYKDISLNASQEINVVASAFNEMVHDLESRYLELQLAMKQLVESEKMVALGNLVAGVSHEINTPIGIGVTAASFMEEKSKQFQTLYQENRMKKSDLEEYLNTVRETTGMIQSNLHRASELIRSFKQVAVDRSVDTKRRFNMKEYIKDVLISLQPNLKKTKHHVTVRGNEGIEVLSDPGAISQIITNFIMNSLIHAYGPDDEGHIAIDVIQDDQELIIQYSDDGKGMPEEVVEQIFHPFFTTNRGGGGTGLGMHIVYNLVTQSLGGTIRCESKVGTGTTFYIQIPLNEG